MNNRKLKVGCRVRIIDASPIERCELNKIGTIVNINDSDPEWITYSVDMGRPRRSTREPDNTCWYLRKKHIELALQKNEQLLFEFMNEVI